MKINLKNIGNTIGNYIVITLTFPNELELVFEQDYALDYNQLNVEISDNLPRIPIVLSSIVQSSRQSLDYLGFKTVYFKKEDAIHRNKNELEIRVRDSIHHTNMQKDSHFFVKIKEKGSFFIKSKIICEELEEPIFYDVPVIVE